MMLFGWELTIIIPLINGVGKYRNVLDYKETGRDKNTS